MQAPRRPDASANWSAFTSFPGRLTTSRRFFRSASFSPAPPRRQRRTQFLQQTLIPDNQQRLRRRLEQVVELPALGSCVDRVSIRQKLHPPAAASGFEQTHTELRVERIDDGVQLLNRKSALPEIR